MMAKVLLASGDFGCGEDVVSIAAMLSVQNVFTRESKLSDEVQSGRELYAVREGDHITLLNVFNAFVRHQKR